VEEEENESTAEVETRRRYQFMYGKYSEDVSECMRSKLNDHVSRLRSVLAELVQLSPSLPMPATTVMQSQGQSASVPTAANSSPPYTNCKLPLPLAQKALDLIQQDNSILLLLHPVQS
jgi:hypothetical protein